ncbi:hypothetical protein [Pelagicoccus mobilis]|uniref:Uncharacterized protein n=1 Tax=Pelagicoccus mobilis TaxID=415221 RepID=A0A934VSB6_9BACT|nr:hypothetical protein [Pelagicoccus mobilis]MBK1880267.1 hypothetical protein [Pelagicoccus mobilis]
MTDQNTESKDDTQPPVFGSWRRVYWFVAIFFVVEVVAFYLITQYYS